MNPRGFKYLRFLPSNALNVVLKCMTLPEKFNLSLTSKKTKRLLQYTIPERETHLQLITSDGFLVISDHRDFFHDPDRLFEIFLSNHSGEYRIYRDKVTVVACKRQEAVYCFFNRYSTTKRIVRFVQDVFNHPELYVEYTSNRVMKLCDSLNIF